MSLTPTRHGGAETLTDSTTLSLLGTFLRSLAGLFAFIWSLRTGLLVENPDGALVIFARGEVGRTDDPAHDDPALWHFATLVDAAALRTLLTPLGVVVIDDGRDGFDHNAALLVINRQGQLVRIFDDTDHEAALVFAQHLARQGSGG